MARRTSPLTTRFGSRVREIRQESGYRLEDITYRGAAGSNGRLSRLERGEVSPTLRTVEELAKALRVEPLDLLAAPKLSRRHRLIAASRGASRDKLDDALDVLTRTNRSSPSPEELCTRIAALPKPMAPAIALVLQRLDYPRHRKFSKVADALRDLRPSELAMAGDVIRALERVADYAKQPIIVEGGAVRARGRSSRPKS